MLPGVFLTILLVVTAIALSVFAWFSARRARTVEHSLRQAEESLRNLRQEIANESRELEQVHDQAANLRQAEDRLRAGQRMEALGQLAGGVAHDFNNMITVVTGYADVLLSQPGTNHDARQALVEIRKAGERCAALTAHLLAFSRRQVLTPTVLDLNGIVNDLSPMLPILLGEEIVVRISTASNLGRVRADPAQIEQVIVNVLVNARDAMPRGGTLTITTSNEALDRRAAADASEIIPGPYVALSIADSGQGMDDATKARMFDPFFTTKPAGEGTGLGLSTAYGFVKQSEGHIDVESAPGRGTTIRVYLPRTADPVEHATPARQTALQPGSETILLVEDEHALCRVLRDILTRDGYRVLTAENGSEALTVLKNHPEPIDILVTDVILPGMNGVTLAQQIQSIRPDVRVLFMSGYNRERIDQMPLNPGDAAPAYIQKPFAPPVFLAKIREVIDESR